MQPQGLWDWSGADNYYTPLKLTEDELLEWMDKGPINTRVDRAEMVRRHRENRAKAIEEGRIKIQAPTEKGRGKSKGKEKENGPNAPPPKVEPVKQPPAPKQESTRKNEAVKEVPAPAKAGQSKGKQPVRTVEEAEALEEARRKGTLKPKAAPPTEKTKPVSLTAKPPETAKPAPETKPRNGKAPVQTFTLPEPDLRPRRAKTREELLKFQQADMQEVMQGRAGQDQVPAFRKRWALEKEMFEQNAAQSDEPSQVAEPVAGSAEPRKASEKPAEVVETKPVSPVAKRVPDSVPKGSEEAAVVADMKPESPLAKRVPDSVLQRTDTPSAGTQAVIQNERDDADKEIMNGAMSMSKKTSLLKAMATGWAQEDEELGLEAKEFLLVATLPISTPVATSIPASQVRGTSENADRNNSRSKSLRLLQSPPQTQVRRSSLASPGAEQPDETRTATPPPARKPAEPKAPAAGLASKFAGKLDKLQIVDFRTNVHAVQEDESKSENGPPVKQPSEHDEALEQSRTSSEKTHQEHVEPMKKAGPVTRLKSVIKSKVADIRRLSLPGESSSPAQPRKTVSFEDVVFAIMHNSQESDDSDGGSIAPEDGEIKPPAEISPTWPTPQLSAEHSPASSTPAAAPASPDSPQDTVELKRINKSLKEQLRAMLEITHEIKAGMKEDLEEQAKIGELRKDLVEESRERAILQYNEKSWKADKEQLLKELEELRERSGQGDSDTVALVEELKGLLLERDQRMKELLADREQQKDNAQYRNWELSQAEESYQQLLTGSDLGGRDHERAEQERQEREIAQRDQVNFLKDQAGKKEAEAMQLRVHLAEMRGLVIELKKRRHQVVDTEIEQLVGDVYYGLQSFAIHEHDALARRSEGQFDLATLSERTRTWRDTYISLASPVVPNRLRPWVFVSILCKTLCEAFKAHYYFGASASSPIQAAVSLAEALRPKRNHNTRQWFNVVRQLIVKKDGDILPQAEQALLQEIVLSVRSDFGSTLPVPWTQDAESRLVATFKKALDLFHILHQQDARYFVDMAPAGQWTFSAGQMEDFCCDYESPEGTGREVEISIFPAVYKRGDDRGR